MIAKRNVYDVRERVKSAHDTLKRMAGVMRRGDPVAAKLEEIAVRDLAPALEGLDYMEQVAE